MIVRRVCDICEEAFADRNSYTCSSCLKEIRTKQTRHHQKLYRELTADQNIIQYIRLHPKSRRADVFVHLSISESQWKAFIRRQRKLLIVADNQWSVKIVKPKVVKPKACKHRPANIKVPLVRDISGKLEEGPNIARFWIVLMGVVNKEKNNGQAI